MVIPTVIDKVKRSTNEVLRRTTKQLLSSPPPSHLECADPHKAVITARERGRGGFVTESRVV